MMLKVYVLYIPNLSGTVRLTVKKLVVKLKHVIRISRANQSVALPATT